MNSVEDQESVDPKDEYKLVNDNMRHYANMRFAQTTLLVVITGVFLQAVYSSDGIQMVHLRLLGGLAFVMTFLFTVWEFRTSDYWYHLRDRAVKLEKEYIHYRQWNTRRSGGFVSTTTAGKAMHLLALLFWLILIIWHPGVKLL